MTELTYQEFMENIESQGYEIDMSEEEFDNLSEEELAELTGKGKVAGIQGHHHQKQISYGKSAKILNRNYDRASSDEDLSKWEELAGDSMHKQQIHQIQAKRAGDILKKINDKKLKKEEVELDEGTQAADSLQPNTKSAGSDPKSRIEMMVSVLQGIDAMPKRDFVKWFDAQQAVFGPGKDYGVGDNSASNQSTIDMKNGSGPKTRDAMPKLSVKEDVEEMFSGSDLSEEFKDKASTLFEAAVSARIIAETVRLEEEFETRFDEAVKEITGELSSKVDSYLDYVVEQWLEDNEVAIESTLRNEIMEEFIDGMKNLFAEHYIDVPEEKVSVIESLASKVEALESKLNEQILENTEIKRSLLDAE